MVFGADAGEKALALRLLSASRFHPLLMDRLARLAAAPALRPQLLQALDTLEKTKDFAQLPALFATRPGDEKELAYLNDALAASLDQLIRDASPDARRLLWMIAVANEPVTIGLLKAVWSGESHERQRRRRIKQMLDKLPLLPLEMQAKLKAMPPEFCAMLDALPPESSARPKIEPLLRHVVGVGLATEERTGSEDDNPDFTCHELVRERIRVWMVQHSPERGELTETGIRLAYAERLEAVFRALQHENMTAALQAGSRALVYRVQAGTWDKLGGFVGDLVTGTEDPRLLEGLIPHLQIAAESAPEGQPRWTCLRYLADALSRNCRSDASLPFYEQAATQSRAAAEAGGEGSGHAWADLVGITGNWANALGDVCNLDASRQRQLESAEIAKRGRLPAVVVMGSELEVLRIDIMQGKVATALPEVEARLAQAEDWWKQHRAGQPVPEAPNVEFLARVYIAALNIASQADLVRKDWKSALGRLDTTLEVECALHRSAEDIAATRMNRASVLMKLPGRFDEAKAELEDCLRLSRGNPAATARVRGSLADLFDKQGDVSQAIAQQRRALSVCEQLPDPTDRVISHGNLSNYLERSGTPSALAEAPRHQLAALVYGLVAGLRQDLQTSLGNCAIEFRRAHAAGTKLTVPRLAQLLADPAFRPLAEWLRQRQVKVDELQAEVDQFLEQAWQVALGQK
jgi:tetratricopeptide (TPR) repeat protein